MRLAIILCVSLLPVIRTNPLVVTNRVHQLFLDGLAYHSSLEPTVCQSESCQSAGKLFEASLNESADPCDDFYAFTCGGWVAAHPLDGATQAVTSDSDLSKIIQDKLKAELSKTPTANDLKIFTFARDFYKSCVDTDTRESVGMTPIKTFMDSVGGWPLAGYHFDEKTFEWEQTLPKLLARVAAPLFSVDVSTDDKNSSERLLMFNPENRGLSPEELMDKKYQPVLDAYKNLIITTAVQLGATNNSELIKEVDELVNFEINMAKELSVIPPPIGPDDYYHHMSFAALDKLSDNSIDWLKLVNRIYTELNSTIRVSADEDIIVSIVDYFKLVPKVLSKTPARVIANYFGWVAAEKLGNFGTKVIQDAQFELAKARGAALKRAEVWMECVSLVAQAVPYAVSRLYIDGSFSASDKKTASLIVSDIKDSFDDIIKASDFLDANTRESALKKLSAIRQNVGYPDWILDDKTLDSYYQIEHKADPKNYLVNVLNQEHYVYSRSFNSLRNPVSKDVWPMMPITVNAAYMSEANSITIPAAFLNPPRFTGSLPTTVNYGAIGIVIGHELTHGFDTSGSQFDADGNLRNWWTDSVRHKFNEKADCFRHEYSDTLDKQSGVHLNGNNTIGEDIADNGGVQEAYRAYQKYVKREAKLERLPVINKYTADQQFFISYGYSMCANYRTERLKQLIPNESHTLNKYRVNIPLSNFETFSDVFKCPTNSAMNRRDKCVLW